MPSPQKLGPDDGVGHGVVAHERLEGAQRLHRPQQVEAADAEGEAIGRSASTSAAPRSSVLPSPGEQDRALDAVGVHVVEQLGQLGALEERVAALK